MKKLLLVMLGSCVISAYAEVPVLDVASLAKLTAELANMEQQVAFMKQNINQLGAANFSWADINSTASQIAGVMNNANALSYASSNVANQFQSTYPGYKADSNYSQSYNTLSTNSLNTFKGTLQALNMSYSTFTNDSARLKSMQSQAQTADGAMKAMSVNSQLAGEVANQVSQLRSVMMAQSSSENAYMAQQAQTEATQKANADAMFKNGSTTAPPYGTYKVDPTFYP